MTDAWWSPGFKAGGCGDDSPFIRRTAAYLFGCTVDCEMETTFCRPRPWGGYLFRIEGFPLGKETMRKYPQIRMREEAYTYFASDDDMFPTSSYWDWRGSSSAPYASIEPLWNLVDYQDDALPLFCGGHVLTDTQKSAPTSRSERFI